MRTRVRLRLAQKAAEAFDVALVSLLAARGETTSVRHRAILVGEDPSNYSALISRDKPIAVDHVLRWASVVEKKGYPPFVFTFSGQEVKITGAERSADSRIVLPSGQLANILDPSSVTIDPVDIFVGLARKRRYAGFLDVSVLHHLAICARLAQARWPTKPGIAAYAAVHDLQEAYVLELPRGMHEALPDYDLLIEAPWQARIFDAVGLSYPGPASILRAVKEIDARSVMLEVESVGGPGWIHRDYFVPGHGGSLDDVERTIALEVLELSDASRWRLVTTAVNAGGGHLPVELDGRASNPTRVGLSGRARADSG